MNLILFFDNYINDIPYQLLLSQRFQNSIEVQLVLRTQRYSRVIYNELTFVFDGNHHIDKYHPSNLDSQTLSQFRAAINKLNHF